jgi:ribosomal protein L32
MITCPTCGAQNDPANRFCDQCGTRLEAAAPAAAVAPAAATANCPSCGATILPGEAFCDNCGADLTALAVAPAPVFSSDAPTALAESAPAPADAGALPTTCPVCGAQTIPGERFCDNCGADLLTPHGQPVLTPNDATMVAPPNAPDDATLVASAAPAEAAPATSEGTPEAVPAEAAPETPAAPVEPPVEPAPAPVEAETPAADATPAVEAETPAADATPAVDATPEPAPVPVETPGPADPVPAAEPAAAEAAPAPATAETSEERRRLEDLVAAHRDTVTQYEQMAARYPADSPPVFIAAGLEEAKRALAQAEADLAAFEAAPAGPDPVEVARLEQLVAAHRDTVTQYEQMAARYPAGSTPAFLVAGLEEAQRALAQAEADLATLMGRAAPAAPAAPAAAPVAAPDAGPASASEPQAAPAAPASPGPRLVLNDGQVIMLPGDKAEIIVGREDPVSNIFPEVDLTPHGGEQGGVSRQHARITHVGDQWALVDLNSTNYTRVDGVRADPNVSLPLHDGAKIQFGRVVTTFHL